MVDTGELLELVAHYVVILIIVTIVLAVVRSVVGDIGFWVELGVIVVLVALYRPPRQVAGRRAQRVAQRVIATRRRTRSGAPLSGPLGHTA
ncbi:hypothetical protein ACFQMA_10430 [Halosimplex aquaticum]|uniref:Uncharacterized protein n=1 Tax=Halosimplex aquaticum TaxID=3026162 RepID=A0ABD5Y763_9EURY|nr:hypothetical protein [Halosimplex aquaticum]